MTELFDVVEIEIARPHRVRVMDRNLNEDRADAVVSMAVMRRGVEEHFYKAVTAGKYADGDAVQQS